MSCSEVRDRLIDYISGELEDDERTAIGEHLQSCTACTREMESTRSLLGAVEASHEEPVISLCNVIIEGGINSRASDIHLQCDDDGLRVRYRIDGVLQDARREPQPVWPPLLTRICVLAGMNVLERHLPQDGRILHERDGRAYDLRISYLPTVRGGQIVMRIFSRDRVTFGLDRIGLHDSTRARLESLLSSSHGMIVAAGPTGCGKTTTMYSMLMYLNDPGLHLMTIEDPVEYVLQGVAQTAVNLSKGVTFDVALRHCMRQDPDVIMVGEIRDRRTLELTVQATLMGHLTMTSLHTVDATTVPRRMLDIGLEPFLVTDTLIGVIAQRLVRCLCPHCRESCEVPDHLIQRLTAAAGTTPTNAFFRARGCDHCRGTGYRGRSAIFEVMTMSAELRELIAENASPDSLRARARQEGMITMLEDGIEKAAAGITSVEEVLRAVHLTL